MMKHLLIIEDEHHLLESMVKFMRSLEHVQVTGCASLTEAFAYLETTRPHLIFSDINLPDGNGLDLVGRLSKQGIGPPLVFISAYLADYRDHIPQDANITALEKPVSMHHLRDIATDKLFQDTNDYAFKLADYIQIAFMGQHTVCLDWAEFGKVTIVEGQAWSAFDMEGSGEEAFKRLVVMSSKLSSGDHIASTRIEKDQAGERNLHGNLDHLLINAIWEDEESRKPGAASKDLLDKESTSGDDTASVEDFLPGDGSKDGFTSDLSPGEGSIVDHHSVPANAADSGESFDELLDRGVMMFLKKDFQPALAILKQARLLNPNHKLLNMNIDRLKQMGFE